MTMGPSFPINQSAATYYKIVAMNAILRIIILSWKNIWRNFWLSFITVSTIIVTLMTVSIILALQVGLRQIIKSADKHIDLSVYFFPSATNEQADSVVTAVKAISGVTEVAFVTKEQALANYQERAKESPELLVPLTVIGDNPFGSSIIIKASEPAVYSRVIEELNKPQYSALIEGQQKGYKENRLFIDSFSSFSDKVKISGLALGSIFAIIAVMLIFNAIRVAIYTQRDEIAIMKLVGASNWFVRGPFLVETVIYSLFAVIISGGLFMIFLFFLQPYLSSYFGGEVELLSYFSQNALVIFGGELVAVSLLNMATGSLALRRYLNV